MRLRSIRLRLTNVSWGVCVVRLAGVKSRPKYGGAILLWLPLLRFMVANGDLLQDGQDEGDRALSLPQQHGMADKFLECLFIPVENYSRSVAAQCTSSFEVSPANQIALYIPWSVTSCFLSCPLQSKDDCGYVRNLKENHRAQIVQDA